MCVNYTTTRLIVTLYIHCLSSLLFAIDSCASAGSPDNTLTEPHPSSNTQQIKNETADVVVQQHSRKLLKMGILMLETC